MSVRLYLVRHGRAAAGFAEAEDPGLDAEGVAQAESMAATLAPLGPLPIVVSPMRRTRETAAPLERRWSRLARIEPAVSEIPSPSPKGGDRAAWLHPIMKSRWPDLDPTLIAWRESVLRALIAVSEPTVIVTHFIAINIAVGASLGNDRVITFEPDHCSITVIDVDSGNLKLVDRGTERATQIL